MRLFIQSKMAQRVLQPIFDFIVTMTHPFHIRAHLFDRLIDGTFGRAKVVSVLFFKRFQLKNKFVPLKNKNRWTCLGEIMHIGLKNVGRAFLGELTDSNWYGVFMWVDREETILEIALKAGP